MRLGSTVGSFRRWGKDCYKKMKELGFDYADIGIGGELDGKTEEEYEAIFLAEKALADAAGVTIWQIHGPWRYPPHDETPENRAERADCMRRSIRIAAKLGVKYWVIHPIMPFGTHVDPEPETLWQMNLDFFRALLPTAKEYGITICYENMPMKALSNSKPEAMLRFIEEMNDESFQFCLDTGHCSVFGLSPAEAVRMAGDRLKVLHVHDNKGHSDDHLPIALGVIDWKDFGKALKEIGFDGVFSFEATYPSTLPEEAAILTLQASKLVVEDILQ